MIRQLHMYWGNTDLPWLHSLSLRSFRRQHPLWRVTLWRPPLAQRCVYPLEPGVATEVPRDVEVCEVDPQAVTGASLVGYDHTNSWTHTAWSDATRLWFLHEYGGLWSDCDVLYFRNVEGSSLDGRGIRMHWPGGDRVYNSLIAAAQPSLPSLSRMLSRVRQVSPAHQAPGGQSPFGADLWYSTFGGPGGCPDFVDAQPSEFQMPPYAYGMHYRAARVMWGSTTPDNWREKLAEVDGLVQAVERVLS